MNVEIHPDIGDTAARLGAGVPYALKVLAGRLADEPDLGQPSGVPGVLSVAISGATFEDCPDLMVGYIRELDRVEIRYVNAVAPAEHAPDTEGRPESAGQPNSAVEVISARLVTEAWRRITRWLEYHAPASKAALRAGADAAAIAVLEQELGLEVPADVRALWVLTAGDDGVNGAGCLPGNQALMSLEAVASVYVQQMDSQAHQDTLNAGRPEYDQTTVWKSSWLPVVSYGVTDRTSGLYLDTSSGSLGRWSRYNEGQDDEDETLLTYLEDVADMLESPDLATRDKPGLIDGVLVWGSRLDPAQEDRWQPLTG
ncbi:SMI1/KNR4 family protein [Streptomyces sp. x-45]|uniref:SMI1/KNR4 family protein n=1 Tax=Streptomyces sp. x-45 TaxID=2789281 RepID=UPI00397F8CB5